MEVCIPCRPPTEPKRLRWLAEPEPEPEPEPATPNPTVFEYLRSLQFSKALKPKSQLSRTTCATCDKAFKSRNRLFEHIRASGHAALSCRPRDALCYEPGLDVSAASFLEWLLDIPEQNVASELPEIADRSAPTWLGSLRPILGGLLDSGDSMFTVIVARMLTTPVGGPSHQWLLRLIEQMAGGGSARAIWETAEQWECFTVTKSAPFHAAVSGLLERPRSMWGLPKVIPHNSPMTLARMTRCPELLSRLLPSGFDLAADCLACCDSAFMCCGEQGALAPGKCGCVVCPETMKTWVRVQVGEQKGVGEIVCLGCSRALEQGELEKIDPQSAATAERITLEKALVAAGGWVWCPDGCGSGGFKAPGQEKKGCLEFSCPGCDVAFCKKCGVIGAYHRTPTGLWRSCEGAMRERDGMMATELRLESAKRCPKAHGGCGALTDRDGGCSHIRCRVCSFEWCWLCEGKYKGRYTTGTKCPCPS